MRSVVTVFRVLEEVARRQPVGVSELSRALDLPKSTTQRGLAVLHDLGWIRPGNGESTAWSLTTKALAIGSRAEDLEIREVALPVMRELNALTQENVHLAVPDGDWVTLVEKVDSAKAVRTFHRLGAMAPIHASSTGKSILACRSREEVQGVIDRGLDRYNDRTIVDPAALWRELERIRELGYAVNRGEWREDVTALGAALLDAEGRPLAALSVSVPAHRLPKRLIPTLGRQVAAAADRVNAASTRHGPAATT